ncbi:MAG TPA: class II aldolase/adducin family protein [Candidatus Desulfovibrio gallistercoris]|nr:class II aldolase/adducin family protein [Candidatus Desulfovibrio gallistercoris]
MHATPLPDLPPALCETLLSCCREAWRTGGLLGFNGNASLLWDSPDGPRVLMTRSGVCKGRMSAADICLLHPDGRLLAGGPASSEGAMHLAVYAARPACRAILHTHPPHLLALGIRLAGRMEDFLRLPLYESDVWRARLGVAPACEPGTSELAAGVAAQARQFPAVWMSGHGLCACGETLEEALGLTEQLEHLAQIQLLSGICDREEGRI